MELNFFVAFIAGLASFLAPCVFVLVPAFLSQLAGISLSPGQGVSKKQRRQIFLNTLFFVLGFTIIFVLLGASLGYVSMVLRDFQGILVKVGGALLIFFGLVVLDLVKVPWLYGGSALQAPKKTGGALSSVLVGGSFAIGWSPCVGPILAAILGLSATTGSVAQSALLLTSYSLGLMIPFLLVGAFTARSARFLSEHNRVLTWFNYIGGVLLIILGILVFTNRLAVLSGYLSQIF